MQTTRVLTGIKPSGTPHLGNYVGAIRPAIAASRQPGIESFFFLADYHALISVTEPVRVQDATLQIAASWLAAGLEPEAGKVWFYRQSDLPETTELTWLLSCVAGKGLLNRAHAYKAANDRNREAGQDEDAGVSAGLYMYPVLMAADILLFNAHRVPVGRDQVQHIEMARDFAQRFNHLYGERFTLPEAAIEEHVATLPGLDGRKMSKSYDNVIPLFAPQSQLRKLVFSMVTDSRGPAEPKETEGSNIFELYQAFASAEETAAMRQAFADGISWADAKQALFERIEAELAPVRERYGELIARPERIEALLQDNAARLRQDKVAPLLRGLREAVGLRPLTTVAGGTGAPRQARALVPAFKQYREADGRFGFKLVEGDRTLLVAEGFASPKECGQFIASLRGGRYDAGDARLVRADGVGVEDVEAALSAIAEADERKAQARAAGGQA